MSDIPLPGSHDAQPDKPSGSAGSPRRSPENYAEIALACGWLLVPAAQYYGTFQRTGLQLEGSAASPELAPLDLTSLYAILVAATLLLLLFRWTARTGTSPSSAASREAEA